MKKSFYISSKNIISQLGYDKFGQRIYLRYGNGTETEYSYEDNRRRLLNMTAKPNTAYGSSVDKYINGISKGIELYFSFIMPKGIHK